MDPKPIIEQPKFPTELPKEIADHAAYQQNSIKTLLAWQAPGRPFRRRKKEFYLSSLLIMFLVMVLLFLFAQYILMLVVLSLVFVAFVLATVPPRNFHYKISSEGITLEDHFYLWQELYDFYFKTRNGMDILHIRTRAIFPGELTITLGEIHKEHATSVLLPYLPYREVIRPTFLEKSGDWLAKNFPLEKTA